MPARPISTGGASTRRVRRMATSPRDSSATRGASAGMMTSRRSPSSVSTATARSRSSHHSTSGSAVIGGTVAMPAIDSGSVRAAGDEHTGVQMHVGMSAIFQGFGGGMSDQEVWAADLRLADLAEPLGYESIWSVEHHFTNYTMCPDVLQFLTYMAGRTKTVQLGSMVLVLPWHDPLRAAEQIVLLDHMPQGRLILGL